MNVGNGIKYADQGDPETYQIIGAALDVHAALGPGFLELVYQAALAEELSTRSIPYQRESELAVTYKGIVLPVHFRTDFICYGTTIIELKALPEVGGGEVAQTLNYLRASQLPKALLINFGEQRLYYRRFIRSQNWK